MSCHGNLNYGGAVTVLAAFQTLKDLGLKIGVVGGAVGGSALMPRLVNNYYDYINAKDLRELNGRADIFLVPSDQLWNYRCFGQRVLDLYLLPFVEPGHGKIAFGTSFGEEKLNFLPEHQENSIKLIKDFDFIGVRESSGLKILEQIGTAGTWIGDPVFSQPRDFYKKLALSKRHEPQGAYALFYSLNPNDKKLDFIYENIKYPLKSIAYTANAQEVLKKHGLIPDADFTDWLYYLMNARFIVTDSFHGTCFALLFNVPFATFGYPDNNPVRNNTRIRSLLEQVHLTERLVPVDIAKFNKAALKKEIYWQNVNATLEDMRKKQVAWLENALKQCKNKPAKNEADSASQVGAAPLSTSDKIKLLQTKIPDLVKYPLCRPTWVYQGNTAVFDYKPKNEGWIAAFDIVVQDNTYTLQISSRSKDKVDFLQDLLVKLGFPVDKPLGSQMGWAVCSIVDKAPPLDALAAQMKRALEVLM